MLEVTRESNNSDNHNKHRAVISDLSLVKNFLHSYFQKFGAQVVSSTYLHLNSRVTDSENQFVLNTNKLFTALIFKYKFNIL